MSRTRTGEAGFALIHAILFIGLLTTVVTVVTGPLLARAQAVRLHAQRVQALYAAEAGVAEALAFLDDDGDVPSTIRGEIGPAHYEVSLKRDRGHAIVIRSTGTCGDQARVFSRELSGSARAAGGAGGGERTSAIWQAESLPCRTPSAAGSQPSNATLRSICLANERRLNNG